MNGCAGSPVSVQATPTGGAVLLTTNMPSSPVFAQPAASMKMTEKRIRPPSKIVSRCGVGTQNSSQLCNGKLDGLTRAHLAYRDEFQLATESLLVDVDAIDHGVA